MARSVGIPARFAIGLPLPAARGSGEIPGYHCWAELYVEGRGWVPVDGSEAAKDPARRDYFFGHHDEDRLEFSRGRHLTPGPRPAGAAAELLRLPVCRGGREAARGDRPAVHVPGCGAPAIGGRSAGRPRHTSG